MGISILFQMGIIPSYTDWTAEDVAKGLQAYLICVEMFVFAISKATAYLIVKTF